jgi:DNA-binding LacI/PurR family transcriptional regulator
LAGRKKMTLGLLVPEISGDFFVPMLRGIERASSAAGYELLIQTTAYRRSAGFRRVLGERNTDGLLLFEDSVDARALAEFEAAAFPVVLLYAEALPPSTLPSVTIENEQGAAEAVEHLAVFHRRRRIVCLVGPEGNHDAASRERGYRAALGKLGIEFDPALMAPGDYRAARAAESIRALLTAGVDFDAVFAGDDGAAMGVLAALRDAGKRVPEDVAVVGFDDQSLAAETGMDLSTVRAPTEEVGGEAVRLLLAKIGGEERISSLVLPTVFVPRASCGCARRDASN